LLLPDDDEAEAEEEEEEEGDAFTVKRSTAPEHREP
jgi:hypothetical protein